MGKDKIRRFAENLTFKNMVQPDFEEVFRKDHPMKGHWHEFFGNSAPIVLELGCGRGEYTVALAEKHTDKNFIGVDIKGARMWRGAKTATEAGMTNAAFLRIRIENICSIFAEGEVDEIWITFPDPQLKKRRVNKRLTSPIFLGYYAQLLRKGGAINLKTDSAHLHHYTRAVAEVNGLAVEECCEDIYGTGYADPTLSIKTAYETKFLAEGIPITYLRFRLDERTEFEAPEFEPDNLLAVDEN
ncbi:MAG: tRNA (guanosine(46)-N7)-methyltransferase TrmB [Tidjanibacter sp.]|nr:tRNA (guanosine(46)-N7)-methyltransferase TrmB [Tidjanibacter sp.]